MQKKNPRSFTTCLMLISFALVQIPALSQTHEKNSTTAPAAAHVIKGYGNASYTLSASEHYMSAWLVAGPVKIESTNPSAEIQNNFFKKELLPVVVTAGKPIAPLMIDGKQYPWQVLKQTDDIVDLDARYPGTDFAAAFALAEIKSDKEVKTFLSVGSDDGIRIWHNGKLIHDNWIGRGVNKDEDLVPITLAPGSNQLLLKVQDMNQGWGFVIRVLNPDDLSDRLITAAGKGDLDQVNLLINAGAGLEKKNASGLTALNSARLAGRQDVVQLLQSKGAKETSMPTLDMLMKGLYHSLDGKVAPGVAVLVSKDGNVIYKNGFGYADIEKKAVVQPDTKFRIGSITKQFTAAAILKLQEQGKISVNDKLSKFVPDFPRGNEVTIHHLLTHTSGIHNFTAKPDFINKVTAPVTEDSLIASFKNDPFDFSPGEKWQYSNSGYFLLGYIVEKVTGKPYGDYLKEIFFEPLHMTNTGIHTTNLRLDKEAKGYTKENNQYKLAANWDMSWAGGAGAIYSTVEDLNTWNNAVFSGKVINEKSIKEAFTPVTLNDGKRPDNAIYGYGWQFGNYRGEEIIQHGGGVLGFISQLARYPEENVTVAILTNLSPPEVNLNSDIIAEFVLWEKMDGQKSSAVNTSVSENVGKYVGRYDFRNGAIMIVSAENNNLFAQLTGQQKFPIFPSGVGEYFWKVVNAKINFVTNANGEVEYGDFEQSGNKIKATKLKDDPIVAIDKGLYTLYAGKYDLGNNMVITVTHNADRIFAQATNQPMLEIFPVSENQFMVKEVNAKLLFVKEPDGKVNKLILDMAGQKNEASRIP